MLDISIAILTYSGHERENLPAGLAAVRVASLLASIAKNTLIEIPRIVVCDDGSDNTGAQQLVRLAAQQYGAEYFVADCWGGVSANYNQGVRRCGTKWVICLSDDTIVTRNWLLPMIRFLKWNSHLDIGQAGWPCVFGYQLVAANILLSKEDFYFTALDDLDPLDVYPLNEDRMTFAPFLRGNCTGPAFVVRRDIWEQMGGFPEDLYQPDEFYAWWVWTHTDGVCVQVPAPPILHYGGASSWGFHAEEELSPYKTCNAAWEKRTGVPFEERGREFPDIIMSRAWVLRSMSYDAWWDRVGRGKLEVSDATSQLRCSGQVA